MKTQQEFRMHADEELASLHALLVSATDDYGFEPSLKEDLLTLELGTPRARFSVSPDMRAHRLRLLAGSRSYSLAWDIVEGTFVLESTGQTLKELMEEMIGQRLGEEVSL